MSKAEPPSLSLGVAEVTVAVRDPIVHEIVLALIRLNRMQGRSLGTQDPRKETPPGGTGPSILVGYIASPADAEHFDSAMRQVGGPPFVALVPHDVDPQLLNTIEKKVTKVIRLPEDARTIAGAIREQFGPVPRPGVAATADLDATGEPA
jgi:hypothetical protein